MSADDAQPDVLASEPRWFFRVGYRVRYQHCRRRRDRVLRPGRISIKSRQPLPSTGPLDPGRNDWSSTRPTTRSTERLPQVQAEEPEIEAGG